MINISIYTRHIFQRCLKNGHLEALQTAFAGWGHEIHDILESIISIVQRISILEAQIHDSFTSLLKTGDNLSEEY